MENIVDKGENIGRFKPHYLSFFHNTFYPDLSPDLDSIIIPPQNECFQQFSGVTSPSVRPCFCPCVCLST